VRCLPCLVWPPQAAEWPKRYRSYGWPDAATIIRVVSNGCDVVGAVHRLYKQHKISLYQWRLSFSRAEIVPLNSWVPVQQIVYHMLRVFTKTERLTGNNNTKEGTLSNYHIKTLMLWACELKPRSWWTGDVNLIRICIDLLYELVVWLTEARCPHYFINDCNLIESSFNLELIRGQLISVSKLWLSSWFVTNYIRRCSHLCPRNVIHLFDGVTTTKTLQNAVSVVIDWRLSTRPSGIVLALGYAEYYITAIVSDMSLTVRSLDFWSSELRNISTSFPVYFLSVTFLHIACRTLRNGLNKELMDVLAVVIGQSICPRRRFTLHSSLFLLSNAISLMKAVGDWSKSRSTVQLIKIELSKAYLYRALSCEDSDSDSIYCLANVYLAVLYCNTGHYQTAIDHCTLVMKSQDHSQCSSHVVQGELLTETDGCINTASGLAVFYQYVRMAALNQQTTHVTVFTTELFAHYLHIKCLSFMKCLQLSDTPTSQSSTFDVRDYVKYINDMEQLYIADVLLWKLANGLSPHIFVSKQQSGSGRRQYPTNYPSKLNSSYLVKLLQKSAVEHLTTFRELEAQEFGSVANIVTTDFEALYTYKRGDYRQCLQFSTQNLRTQLYAVYMPNVQTFPEFIQLLDNDFASLTALTLIVDRKCRNRNYFNVFITQLTLSLYLMTQCQLKLRHSLTSLAQTLMYIKVAYRRHHVNLTLNRLILKMIAHKALIYMTSEQ